MLNTLLHPLTLPDHRSISYLEGTGNFAVSRYYDWPWAPFYQKKLRLALSMLGCKRYTRALDFGSGCGIFIPELKKRCDAVVKFEKGDSVDPRWKFDLIMCASVLEFTHLDFTMRLLANLMQPYGKLVVASPMDTRLTRAYYRAIGDKQARHSHGAIAEAITKYFDIERYQEWHGLYFALRASPK